MIKLLLGGSPCTNWSIAKGAGRETKAEGVGWELFRNYAIAKEKFKPDFFLYENNKSASQAIKDQIQRELGHGIVHINSALVSAQNRQRFYCTNLGENVTQPEDRGILLRDVLETGVPFRNEKAYCLDASYYKGGNLTGFQRQSGKRLMVAEPISTTVDGKAFCLTTNEYKGSTSQQTLTKHRRTMIAEPLRVGTIKNGGQGDRIYDASGKSCAITAQSGGVGGSGQGLYAVPIRVGDFPNKNGKCSGSQAKKIYSVDGKGRTLCASSSGGNCDVSSPSTGLCAVLVEDSAIYQVPRGYNNGGIKHDKTPKLTSSSWESNNFAVQAWDGKTYPVYEIRNGLITIKDKSYPIKLADGSYIIRKLTVTECERLQTFPDGYTTNSRVSNMQCYKGLGNGWTAEVIIHILEQLLKDVPRDEKLLVLSMYDGIGTGRYCLDKMGFTNVEYHAYEIDKYAMQIANHNYPDIIQHGDAFQLRKEDWSLEN